MDEEIKLPKYQLIWVVSDKEEFVNKVNALVELGYKAHTQKTNFWQGEHLGTGQWVFTALMSLSSTVSYEGATNFVNLEFDKNAEDGTPLIEKMLSEGWKPIAHYSKHITLMEVQKGVA